MAEVLSSFGTTVVDAYNLFLSGMPLSIQKIINLSLIAIVLVFYAILIWNFYRWISKRQIFKLSIWIRSKSSSPGGLRFLGVIFYLLENVVLLPIIIFLWFGFFTIFLILMTENMPLGTILSLSAIIIAAIRMTAYYKEDLSRDLAKLLPLTFLGISLTQFGVFNFSEIINNIVSIPQYFGEMSTYFLFIFIVEFILTIFDLIFRYFNVSEEELKELLREEENEN